ncbi:hypothetical protein EKN83_15170 [Enterobacter sp. WCHEn090032]|nr:hypothetical protein EKN83_15170 [Enterobacter sp. WCHEn090032]
MDAVIGDLCLESLSGFIQTQVFQRDNGNIFICAKMRQGSRFSTLLAHSRCHYRRHSRRNASR